MSLKNGVFRIELRQDAIGGNIGMYLYYCYFSDNCFAFHPAASNILKATIASTVQWICIKIH